MKRRCIWICISLWELGKDLFVWQHKSRYTVKKDYRIFHPQPGCHLPNSPWRGIIKIFLARESLVSDIPSGDGKMANLFLQCMQYEGVNSAWTQRKGNFNLVFQALIQNMLSQRGMSFNLLYTESTRIDFSVDRVSAEYFGAHWVKKKRLGQLEFLSNIAAYWLSASYWSGLCNKFWKHFFSLSALNFQDKKNCFAIELWSGCLYSCIFYAEFFRII
jgi:hypothetical protein